VAFLSFSRYVYNRLNHRGYLRITTDVVNLNKVFGPPPKDHAPTQSLAQHGFARNNRWEYLGKTTSETSDASVKLDFGLYNSNLDETTRKAWDYEFGLVYSVTLSKGSLQTMVNVSAPGEGKGFEFQVLLHTYLRIKV
jgi:glucose-6-phosphate 1-epimerase